ncbi:MAG: endonuclease/exonuclease/phosphatase family protein [Ruminococcaceae bacterium]|jgi:endonuclease/exonuclease/phosphatase family metal-dependent hydrolase|nr:endonuclease/exonuclease/phosphatase family protein [Oscillospiraceae bacterium]
MKKVLKIVLCVLLALAVVVVGYLAYVLIDYHRLGDHIPLEVSDNQSGAAATGTPYQIVSWNIGFGAYESDYGFFMDGGTESWAWSGERLDANLQKIAGTLAEQQSDFYIVQEVDRNSTRSYHRDETASLCAALTGRGSVWAQNYDSPFLFYPLTQPHGKSVSGIMTFSPFEITFAVRRELPIEDSLMRLVDLDRCYSAARIPVEGGKELVLYNMHLSAYTSDGAIAEEQLRLLLADMRSEYEKGNYVVGGGDFNKDILGDSSAYFGKSDIEYNWAQPLPEGIFDGTGLRLVAPLDESDPVPSCRNADGPYHQGQYVLTIDGFIVSDNVSVSGSAVIDTEFACSDHNPVEMTFTLEP